MESKSDFGAVLWAQSFAPLSLSLTDCNVVSGSCSLRGVLSLRKRYHFQSHLSDAFMPPLDFFFFFLNYIKTLLLQGRWIAEILILETSSSVLSTFNLTV